MGTNATMTMMMVGGVVVVDHDDDDDDGIGCVWLLLWAFGWMSRYICIILYIIYMLLLDHHMLSRQ